MNITFLSETAVGYKVLLHLMCFISLLSADTQPEEMFLNRMKTKLFVLNAMKWTVIKCLETIQWFINDAA